MPSTDLYAEITKTIQQMEADDPELRRIANRIRDGTATGEDAHAYSVRYGELSSQAIREHITPEKTPDFSWDISRETVRPMLENNFRQVTDTAKEVQAIEDKATGVGLQAVSPELPEGRINALTNAVGESAGDWDRTMSLLTNPVVNITQSFYDSFVEKNAKIRNRLGLSAKIVRKVHGSACKWCMNLAGSYEYPDVPKDVYRRHDNCRCSVVFHSGKDRQNVWSKRSWKDDEETLLERQKITLPDDRDPAKMEVRKTVGLQTLADELSQHPSRLAAYTPERLKRELEKEGFEVKPLKQGSLRNIPFEDGGGFKVNFEDGGLLQYHPETKSHHGGAYYKISTGKGGVHRYDLDGTEKTEG